MVTEWHNWSGLATARPRQVRAPRDVDDVVAAVRLARREGTGVRTELGARGLALHHGDIDRQAVAGAVSVQAVRDRLDADHLFANDYLDRVLGA